MLKKIFNLTTIFTILSLILTVISCKEDDSDTSSNEKEILEGILHYDGVYSGTYTNNINSLTSEISFSFTKGNNFHTHFKVFKKESNSDQLSLVDDENYSYKVSSITITPIDKDENEYEIYTLTASTDIPSNVKRSLEELPTYLNLEDLSSYKDKGFGLSTLPWEKIIATGVSINFSLSDDRNTITISHIPQGSLLQDHLTPIVLTYTK